MRTRFAAAGLALAALAAAARAQDADALRRELDALERRRAEILRLLEEEGGEPAAAPAPVPPEEPPAKEPPAGSTLLEEIEVVASGFPRERGLSTNPVSVLDGEWFRDRGVSSVADGLRTVPGATVSRGGTPGAATSLFLRGAGSNQVLVLQDGIPLNDATAGGQFNFFDLDAVDLDRVEILRGSYGVLYGSSALGGVVNLVSRRGDGPPSFRADAGFGSFGARRESLSGSGGDGDADWSFGVAESGWEGPRDREAFRSLSLAGRFGARVGGDGRAELAVRALDSTAEDPYDFGAPIPRDPDISRERELLALGLSLEKPVAKGLTARVRASITDIDSEFRNGGNAPAAPAEFRSTLGSTATTAGAALRAVPWEDPAGRVCLEVVAGGDFRTEESIGFSESPFGGGMDLDRTTRDGAGFLLATGSAGPLTLTGGARWDHHSISGSEASPEAGARLDLGATGTSLRANYGEGFRAPTPVEFADPFVGNPGLGAERSVSFDAGADQEIGEGVRAEATWFLLRTRDLIAYDPATSRLENLDRARVPGIELGVRADVGGGLSLRASGTRQRPRNAGSGARLPNRPDGAANLGAAWRSGCWTLTADLSWQGSVDDLGARGPDQDLRDRAGRRAVLDLGARWKATDRLTVHLRVDNAWNEKYVESPYAPRGLPFSVFGGVSLDF